MSLITKKPIAEREAASYKLDRSTIELVKFYSEFIGSPQEHVVNQALLYVFRKDREFSAWLKANNKPELLRKAKSAEPKPNGGAPAGTQQGGHVAAIGNGKKV
jgi:hypothetical protein